MKPAIFMTQDMFFRKCGFCNVFHATDRQPSGDLLHTHDYTQIWYVTRGQCEHYVEDRFYLMTAGDTFLIPPKMEHRTVICPDSAVISVELSLDELLPERHGRAELQSSLDTMMVMNFLENSRSRQPRFRFRSEVIPRVDRLMREILEEFEGEQPCYQDMLRVKIQELLLLFIREFMVSPEYRGTDLAYERYRSLMDKAIAYIDEHYTESLSLEDACRISTLSKTYFCYLFKLITQKTFVEYITERRIRGAMQLLEETDISIQAVSEQTGFHDAAHFSRTFKKLAGVSPRAYRKLRSSAPPEQEVQHG